MDRDNDFCIFALAEYLVCSQEGESVGTDIFVAAYSVSEFLNLIVQVLFRSIRGYLRLLLILGLVVMVILKACSPFSGAGEMVALSQQYRILPAVTCSIQEADPLIVSFF